MNASLRVVLLCTLVCALTSSLACQTADPTSSGQGALAAEEKPWAPSLGMVAKVNGKAITGADLNYFALGMAETGGSITKEFYDSMRRMLAERLLLADEAERLGLKLNEYEIGSTYESIYGSPPPYADIEKVGLPLERQKQLVRSLIYAELYVLHRVGIAFTHAGTIPADPLLTRMMDVTPKQLKDYYRDNPELFTQPPSVSFTVWPCDEMSDALAILEQLKAGEEPDGEVVPSRSRMSADDVARQLSFMPGAVELLLDEEPGSVGGPFSAGTEGRRQALIMRVDERHPEELVGFTGEVQRNLERRIQSAQLELARREALEQLRSDARSVFWPADLFEDPSATPDEPAVPGLPELPEPG